MNKYLDLKNNNISQIFLLAILLIPGIIFRFDAANNHIDILTEKFLPDDAYYYFTIARNIAEGHGSTFDQLTSTNGYHPLWMILITPFWLIYSDLHFPVIRSIMLGALLSAGASIFIFNILKELKMRLLVSYLGAILYFYNYMTFNFSLNGLETSLTTCTTSLAFWLFLREKYYQSISQAVIFGISLGLAVLSRTDLALLFLPIAVYCSIRFAIKKEFWKFFAVGISGFITVLPWFAWCKIQFGSFIQVSGKALAFYEHTNYFAENPHVHLIHPEMLSELYQRANLSFVHWSYVSGFMPVDFQTFNHGKYFIATFLILYFLTMPFLNRRQFTRLWPIYLFIPIYFTTHVLIRWAAREWYAAIPGLLLTLLLVLFIETSVGKIKKKLILPATVLIFASMIGAHLFTMNKTFQRGFYYGQDAFPKGVAIYNRIIPKGERVGISDCGYTGYVMTGHQIVNLDGLVNNHAYEASRNARLADYMLETKLDRVVLRPYLIKEHFLGPRWYLKWIRIGPFFFSAAGPGFQNVLVYRVLPDNQEVWKNILFKNWTFLENQAQSKGTEAGFILPYADLWGNVQLEIVCKSNELQNETIQCLINNKSFGIENINLNYSRISFPIKKDTINDGDNVVTLIMESSGISIKDIGIRRIE